MATPAIALRFRDTTPNIDTIAEHRSILRLKNAVWWGWWKKDFERAETEFLEALRRSRDAVDLLIIDRSTRRTFLAECRQWAVKPEEVNQELVPTYYQQEFENVAGWFLLTSIEDIEYAAGVADLFGDRTFLGLDEKVAAPSAKFADALDRRGKSSVLHLSDLHFGADYAFLPRGTTRTLGDPRRTLTECIVSDIDGMGLKGDIAAVVVTGDFMSRAEWDDTIRRQALDEFVALRSELDLAPEQVFVAPGNHDIIRYPPGAKVDVAAITVENQTTYRHEREFRTFAEELMGRSWRDPLNYVRRVRLRDADLLICVLNSCTIVGTEWTEYGYVGESGLDAISSLKNAPNERPTYRFMALHHHLLPVAEIEAPQSKGISLNLDASKLLQAAQEAGVHVALHGHQHMPKISLYQTLPLGRAQETKPLYVISNGSTGAVRLPNSERNAYCLFRIGPNELEIKMRELRPDGKPGGILYDGPLDVTPAR